MFSNILELQRIGERPYGSTVQQPPLLHKSILIEDVSHIVALLKQCRLIFLPAKFGETKVG